MLKEEKIANKITKYFVILMVGFFIGVGALEINAKINNLSTATVTVNDDTTKEREERTITLSENQNITVEEKMTYNDALSELTSATKRYEEACGVNGSITKNKEYKQALLDKITIEKNKLPAKVIEEEL